MLKNKISLFPTVEYVSMDMWFDYQALFDKTKSVKLKQPCNIEVKHKIFAFDELARKSLFGNNDYGDLLKDVKWEY